MSDKPGAYDDALAELQAEVQAKPPVPKPTPGNDDWRNPEAVDLSTAEFEETAPPPAAIDPRDQPLDLDRLMDDAERRPDQSVGDGQQKQLAKVRPQRTDPPPSLAVHGSGREPLGAPRRPDALRQPAPAPRQSPTTARPLGQTLLGQRPQQNPAGSVLAGPAPAGETAPWHHRQIPTFGLPLGLTKAAAFYRQLGIMIQSGLPLDKSIPLAGDVGGPAYRYRARRWAKGCTSGQSLSSQMWNDQENPLWVALLRTGEETGRLPEMCRRISEQIEHTRLLRNTLVSGLVKPMSLLLSMLMTSAIVSFMSGGSPWLFLILPLAPLVIGAALYGLVRAIGGVGGLAALMLSPGFSFFALPYIESQVCLVLTNAFAAGMKPRLALELAGAASGNRIIERRMVLAGAGIDNGSVPNLTIALQQVGLSHTLISIVQSAEAAGRLDETLAHSATQIQESFQSRTTWGIKIFTGILYGIMILIVAYFIISFWMAYYNGAASAAAAMGG